LGRKLVQDRRAYALPIARILPNDEIDRLSHELIEQLGRGYPLTEKHSREVAELCAAIACALSLPHEQVIHVARCGLVHDIGKVVIPRGILSAPRALTPEEWDVVKSHCAAGAAILNEIRELRALAPVARSHHERLDGRGYPDGLSAAQIDLPTRIVAAADAFDAMTGKRSYRRSVPVAAAIEELRNGAGTQFDGAVVEAIVRVVALGTPPHATTRA
jgi:putative nucleotidyltransferase with HDIG domain